MASRLIVVRDGCVTSNFLLPHWRKPLASLLYANDSDKKTLRCNSSSHPIFGLSELLSWLPTYPSSQVEWGFNQMEPQWLQEFNNSETAPSTINPVSVSTVDRLCGRTVLNSLL
jgi:hypothetical protein